MLDKLVFDIETKNSIADVGGQEKIRDLDVSFVGVYSCFVYSSAEPTFSVSHGLHFLQYIFSNVLLSPKCVLFCANSSGDIRHFGFPIILNCVTSLLLYPHSWHFRFFILLVPLL